MTGPTSARLPAPNAFRIVVLFAVAAVASIGLAQGPDAAAGAVIDRLGYDQVACSTDELASSMADNVRGAFTFVACGVRQGQTLEADLPSLTEALGAHAYEPVLDWDVQRIEHPTRGLDIHYAAFERRETTDPALRGALAMVALPWFEDRSLVVLAIGTKE